MKKRVIEHVWANYHYKRKRKVMRNACMLIGVKMKYVLTRTLRKFGTTRAERGRRIVTTCLKFNHQFYGKHYYQHRAKELVTGFMKLKKLSKEFSIHFHETLLKVVFIQKKYRNLRVIQKKRRTSLRGPILENQMFQVNKAMLANGRQDLYHAISKLSEHKKDFVCDCVITLAQFDFKI